MILLHSIHNVRDGGHHFAIITDICQSNDLDFQKLYRKDDKAENRGFEEKRVL